MEALYYLVKPVDADKISICMERILARYNEQERQRVILAEAEEYADGKPVSRVTLWLQPEDIVYVEAFSHNTTLYTKEKCYLVREGISVWRERLAGEVFCSCHRSYLVNLFHVARLEREAVVLDDGRRVPLSRRSYREVNQAFICFYSKMKKDCGSRCTTMI